MPQMVLLLKRKPGMSKEAFKVHYETSHADMARRYQGHLIQDYRRNYLGGQMVMDDFFIDKDGNRPQVEDAFDAVTVISFATDADMQEFLKIGKEHGDEYMEDEFRFLDREKCMHFVATQEVA